MPQAGFLSLLLACLLSGGCVVTQLDMQTRDIMDIKRRLSDVERSLRNIQEESGGSVRANVETLVRNQADFQAELDGVRVDVQSMQGRTGDQERINDGLRQDMTLLRDEVNLQMADHDRRLTLLEAGPRVVEPAPAAAQPVAGALPAAAAVQATPAGESALELYDRALQRIREQQEYAAGREMMQTFLKRYPADPLAINAAYWIGEAYYAEKAYDKAILQFEDIVEKYGEHPKVAAAILKQSLAFEASGDRDTATLLLKRVIERFPLSEEAVSAREKLQIGGN